MKTNTKQSIEIYISIDHLMIDKIQIITKEYRRSIMHEDIQQMNVHLMLNDKQPNNKWHFQLNQLYQNLMFLSVFKETNNRFSFFSLDTFTKRRIKTSIELFWQFSFPRINNFLSTITKEKQNNEYLTENIYPPPPWSGIVTHRVIQDFLRIDFSFHFQTIHLDGFINYKIKAKDTFTFLSQREFLWSESMFVKEQNAFITVPSFPSFSLSL